MPSADAVARAVAWLQTSGDGLPALQATDGGPWKIIQAYWPRTPAQRDRGLYVVRAATMTRRFGAQRKIDTYEFLAKVVWPAAAGTGTWETDQTALDAAIDLTVQRMNGFVEEKTWGGRFLSVAEAPEHAQILVRYEDPERMTGPAVLRASITWAADDVDYVA